MKEDLIGDITKEDYRVAVEKLRREIKPCYQCGVFKDNDAMTHNGRCRDCWLEAGVLIWKDLFSVAMWKKK